MKARNFLPVLIGICICSCSTIRDATNNPDDVALHSTNLTALNGSFKRFSTVGESDLFWDFFVTGYNKNQNDRVKLTVIDDRHIRVALISDGNLLREKILKGKIEGGYFVFNRRTIVYPLLLANLYKDSKIRVGILKNGNLTTDSKSLRYGTIIIFPFFEKEENFNREFETAL
ncbi:MAG: hypothetical protein EOO50_06485 [Flavobacterium sp.]|uniref:hypothetical protein n=1 Tax=Flavobacterium sp. TaxID=239 RepID=UPI0011F9E30D|nr:hypothetical protein [Flavobacterium sp.]RZJ67165.1 MAG: hypothetical protein EOO50_06485 [Flavobacterium sp.]